MNTIFQEFEYENTRRTYPFASGCKVTDTDGIPIGTGILIDAVLYPVNPEGIIYLSSISQDGTVEISDSKGPIMTAHPEKGSDKLEFFETGGVGRHVGTVLASSSDALGVLTNGGKERTFRPDAASFASSCVFPVRNDGVLSLDVSETGVIDGDFAFTNGENDDIRVSTNESGNELRFDILPHPTGEIPESIQHIYCIVDGRTPFRILKLSDNTVSVYLDNIDKSVICSNAHRENAFELADTCDCGPKPEPSVVAIPRTYQTAAVDITNNADSAFYLVVPNCTGYDNPMSVTLVDGIQIPKVNITTETDKVGRASAEGNFIDDTTSKGAVLQVPGLRVD